MSVGPPFSHQMTWWAWQKLLEAAADGAAPVSDGEGDALRGGGVAVLVAQPERLALRVEQGRKDVGIEGQSEEFAGRQGGAVDQAGIA